MSFIVTEYQLVQSLKAYGREGSANLHDLGAHI